jgi:hypothetical protein
VDGNGRKYSFWMFCFAAFNLKMLQFLSTQIRSLDVFLNLWWWWILKTERSVNRSTLRVVFQMFVFYISCSTCSALRHVEL